MKSIRIAAALGLALGASLGLSAGAMAQDKPVQLRLSHWVPPAHPLQAALQDWASSLQQASGGTITSTIFPSEQLGKAFDHYDMARDGIADLTYVNPGYQPGRFPINAAAELPLLYKDGKGGSAALDTWYRKYAATEMKDVHYCFAFIHDPGAIHSRKKVVTPADFKGIKMRPANATVGELVTLLGGTNVKASAPESRDMLERGVADGITFPWGSMLLFGIDKVAKFHIDMPFYAATFVWVMNKAKYESLASAQKKAVDDHCTTEWAQRLSGPWAEFEANGRTKIKAMPDHEVITLSTEQLAEWRKVSEPLQASWAANVRKQGLDPDAVMAEFKAALAKYGQSR